MVRKEELPNNVEDFLRELFGREINVSLSDPPHWIYLEDEGAVCIDRKLIQERYEHILGRGRNGNERT